MGAFLKLDFKRDTTRPGPVKANICLKDGGQPLTPSIAGLAEFDSYVEQIRADLTKLQREAHRKFEQHNAQWKSPH